MRLSELVCAVICCHYFCSILVLYNLLPNTNSACGVKRSERWYVLSTGISGWYKPEVIHDIVHNRTVNLRGGLGHNIAMDRVCEFLNAEFKGTSLLHEDFNCLCKITETVNFRHLITLIQQAGPLAYKSVFRINSLFFVSCMHRSTLLCCD